MIIVKHLGYFYSQKVTIIIKIIEIFKILKRIYNIILLMFLLLKLRYYFLIIIYCCI